MVKLREPFKFWRSQPYPWNGWSSQALSTYFAVSAINFWRSATMLITSTIKICIHHLGRVEEMVFATRRIYASAVLGVIILSVRPSACHTRALWLIQRTYRRYFYTTWKGNASSQMWFFVQLCSSWQDFKWLKVSLGPSAIAELLVLSALSTATVYSELRPMISCKVATGVRGQRNSRSHFRINVKKLTWHFWLVLLRFQNVPCRSVSVGFAEKTSVFGSV